MAEKRSAIRPRTSHSATTSRYWLSAEALSLSMSRSAVILSRTWMTRSVITATAYMILMSTRSCR
jgi:hypothetical protein